MSGPRRRLGQGARQLAGLARPGRPATETPRSAYATTWFPPWLRQPARPAHRSELRTDPLPGPGQEPQPPAHAVRLGELADAGPGCRPDWVTARREPARNRPTGPDRDRWSGRYHPHTPHPGPTTPLPSPSKATTPRSVDDQRFPRSHHNRGGHARLAGGDLAWSGCTQRTRARLGSWQLCPSRRCRSSPRRHGPARTRHAARVAVTCRPHPGSRRSVLADGVRQPGSWS